MRQNEEKSLCRTPILRACSFSLLQPYYSSNWNWKSKRKCFLLKMLGVVPFQGRALNLSNRYVIVTPILPLITSKTLNQYFLFLFKSKSWNFLPLFSCCNVFSLYILFSHCQGHEIQRNLLIFFVAAP